MRRTPPVATARGLAGAQGLFCCAHDGDASDSIASATHQHRSLEKVRCSYVRSNSGSDCEDASGRIRLVRDAEGVTTTRPDRAQRRRSQPSTSGDRRSARLKRDACGLRIDELGAGRSNTGKRGLRPRQIRRCCGHHCVGQRHDGADCAAIGWLAGGPMAGGGSWTERRRKRSPANFVRCVPKRVAAKPSRIVKPRLLRDRRCDRLRATAAVEVPERQQELDRQREKREPRSKPDV